MFAILKVRNLVAATVAVAALTVGGLQTASAGNCYWKTIVTYVTVTKPYVEYETRYDHCGKPYEVKFVSYKTIQVPVTKQVKVCY